jgi:hypothetical protein
MRRRIEGVGMGSEKRSYWCETGYCFLCIVFFCLWAFLLLCILFVVLEIPHGYDETSLRNLMGPIYRGVISPTVAFVADIIKLLFPWPFIVLILLIMIAWGPERMKQVLAAMKLKLPGGIEYEGGGTPPEVLKKDLIDAQKIVEGANKALKSAYDSARVYASQLRDKYDIPASTSELSRAIAELIGAACPDDYRLTLYIPDFVFGDRLYQLTEYYDKKGKRISEDRSGRTFSIRYGIIGRVWRSGVPEVEGDLIPRDDRARLGPDASNKDVERFIARLWGLTLEEAINVRPYKSYGAIRIDRADRPLGVLYFDSKKESAFGDTETLKKKIGDLLENAELVKKLLEISREVAPWSGRIEFFKN